MELSKKSQVAVAIDVLETEAMYARCIADTLQVIRIAVEHSPNADGDAIGSTCWLLGQILYMHEDTLVTAARGGLAGPQDRSA